MRENDINISIGARLHKLRCDRQLTLESLAAITGVSVSMLSAIERGRKSPTLTILNKINTGLEISLAELFVESDDHDCSILRREDMHRFYFNGGDELLMLFDCAHCKRFDVKLHRLSAHSRWDSEPHYGGDLWEYCMVVRGILDMHVGGTVYRVETDEVFSFRADVSHSYVNAGDEELNMIIISAYR